MSSREYELLIEGYEKQELWMEGTRAVVLGLTHNPTAFQSLATAWARLKREAMSQKDIFKSM